MDTERITQATLAHPVVQRLTARLAALAPHDATIRKEDRLAAVMALVRIVRDDDAELLFIKRADVAGDPWSGHIAFPGGRFDVIDTSLADTALRETREELAVDVLQHGKLLGRLDDIAPRSRLLPPVVVRPFVGVVPPDTRIVTNREVAYAFWVPVRALRADAARFEQDVTLSDGSLARFPAYRVATDRDAHTDSHVVWGMTERIVAQLLPLFA